MFGEAVPYWNRLKASGEIMSVELVLLGAHGGDLSGLALLRGDPDLGAYSSGRRRAPQARSAERILDPK